jgi:hypothetical protein
MSRPTAKSTKSKPPPTPQQLKQRERNRLYHQNNRDRRLKSMQARQRSLTPAQKLRDSARRRARPSMPRPGSARSKDPRLIALARAYCDWSDIEEVVRIYIAAAIMCELTGETYVVDHAIPVVSPFVCGLHTHTNLQVIRQSQNIAKGNWVWPDMWPISWETMEILENPC